MRPILLFCYCRPLLLHAGRPGDVFCLVGRPRSGEADPALRRRLRRWWRTGPCLLLLLLLLLLTIVLVLHLSVQRVHPLLLLELAPVDLVEHLLRLLVLVVDPPQQRLNLVIQLFIDVSLYPAMCYSIATSTYCDGRPVLVSPVRCFWSTCRLRPHCHSSPEVSRDWSTCQGFRMAGY